MLVGRDREIREIEAALATLARGAGGLYLLAGEPGIGKTRIATEAIERARAAGIRTAWGHCWEAGGAPALWPWREAFQALRIGFPEYVVAGGIQPRRASSCFAKSRTRSGVMRVRV